MDNLRNAVFGQATVLGERLYGCSWIAAASGAVSVPAEKIIALIVARKLRFLGQEPGNQRMCDLFINRDELRDCVYGPEAWPPKGWLTIDEARSALHLNNGTVAWLVRKGILPTTRHWHQRRRRHSRLITKADLEAFTDRYVSLGALATEARIQANHVARRLERKGIMPLAFPTHLNKIYLRAAVQPPGHVGRLILKSVHAQI
ncbi:helix-turn-helix domain-containing protein [Paenirhodobacter populi]|uniref:Helix-turn-helix domain-containing protein n=1 Tax=Paenirhodobacter populi TaxID=2306993 RepID=A0A443IJN8_9RHOB|nr:helix-turn-helix domain-containing protein [Sinirhodobacter populi]RWR04804.1 hypothetical protein D2T33_20630 [Sinirhodobacter populi]